MIAVRRIGGALTNNAHARPHTPPSNTLSPDVGLGEAQEAPARVGRRREVEELALDGELLVARLAADVVMAMAAIGDGDGKWGGQGSAG